MSVNRPWALPLVPLYWLGLEIKNLLYDQKSLRVRWLAEPVISVGSLSAGGAGKTPVVMALAELLARHGIASDVLSRGYGRGSGVVEEVETGGGAARYGDEPLEMAQAGLRVFVGAERYEAGALAEKITGAAVHLLDDGFQHRRLGRALDVVLLTEKDLKDCLLPAGDRRETFRSLRRAEVLVIREDEKLAVERSLPDSLRQAQLWIIRRHLQIPAKKPRRPLAFCGIARPTSFFDMLKAAGCELAGEVVFPDHHFFSAEDFGRLREAARYTQADGFVTTAKDAVKIASTAMQQFEEIGPLWIVQLRVEFTDEVAVVAALQETLAK